MTELVAVTRLVLAGVFVVSAVAKLRDREGSRTAVEGFGVPGALVGLVAAGLPFVEIASAVLLVLPDPFATTGAVVSLVMLLVFTAAVVTNLVKGNRVDCHCFGSLGDSGAIGWHTVGRNGVFLALAAVSLVGAGSLRSVPGVVADMSAPRALAWLGGLLLVGAVVVMGYALQQLVTKYGAVLVRLEALEHTTGLVERPLAPAFTIPDLDGHDVSLESVLEAGRAALLTFVSPTCHNCTALLPDIAAWQTDEGEPLEILVLSDGSADDIRAKIAAVDPALRVLVDGDRSVATNLGVMGTPAAVLVDLDGRTAGPVVHGADDVRRLHADTFQQLTGAAPDHHVHQIQAPPVRQGDAAPDTVVELENGEHVPLSDAFGEDAVALFWRFDCGFCAQILEDVKALEATTPIRIISGSSVHALRESGLTSPILADPTGELEGWLRVPGTPTAARIKDGVLASNIGVGGPEVLQVLRAATTRSDDLVDQLD